MKGARAVAAAAAMGNMLNGWDSAMLAGALLYIEPEFDLDSQAVLEGSVAAASLVGAAISTTFAGSSADRLGRRKTLCISAVIFCIGALFMVWSPNVYMLMVARLIDGVGVGLAVTVGPMYISEIAPSEIRGELNTFPQFAGTGGMFLSYCISFGMSLSSNPSWRLMLGITFIPSLVYLALGIFYLPESPRWLVSKGRTKEAREVLQLIRNKEDVSGEMALLVEGLAVGGDAVLEEYIIELEDEDGVNGSEVEPHIKIFTPEDGTAWIARPVSGITGSQKFLSRPGSLAEQATPRKQSIPFMDPMVSLMGSLKGTFSDTFTGFGSLTSNVHGHQFEAFDDGRNDEENVGRTPGGYESDGELAGPMDDGLTSPLLSRQTTGQWEEEDFRRVDSTLSRAIPKETKGSVVSQSNLPHGSFAGSIGSTGIGGGWQLAWQWTGPKGTEGKAGEGEFKRIYLFQEGPTEASRMGSMYSLPRYGSNYGSTVSNLEPIQAAALVRRPSQHGKDVNLKNQVGPALLHPAEMAKQGPSWSELLEGGVRQALFVGAMLQILEQFGGINAVLNFTPEILEDSGVDVLLSSLGIDSDSASLLSSAVVQLISLPCILVAMRLMDKLGRRTILLRTLPVLITALLALIIINIVSASDAVFATVSIISVVVYVSVFVMGFGPIPNMLCAEIFPTRVRGPCIGICQAAMWLTNILVTELFPVLEDSIGVAGTFAFFAVFCVISWIFVFLKVPETKGMPLEVIVEFFALSAAGKQKETTEDEDGIMEVQV